MTGLRGVMVAVDYTDLLKVTLPYNAYHFDDITIITDEKSHQGVLDVCWSSGLCQSPPINIFSTELFYDDGAIFNKWKALEWALDLIGRYGWMCLMDADVLWPKEVHWDLPNQWEGWDKSEPIPGFLYSPLRRMYPTIEFLKHGVPPEGQWSKWPIHRNVNEWAGYSQIFHASDPVLGSPPWHDTNWKHAGGADSFFQMKWKPENKIRPPFEVLHIGEAGTNWCGRATQYLDGTSNPRAVERQLQVKKFLHGRRGKEGMARFDHEKL